LRHRGAALPRWPDGRRRAAAPRDDGLAPATVDGRRGGRGDTRMSPAATLLYVEGLTVSFDGFRALDSLNLILDRTERIRILIGPNGAGKTTLFDVLTGSVTPVAGRVLFQDTVNVLGLSEHAIANLGVIRKFQTPSVFPGHTVFENMVLAGGQKRF